MADGSVVIEILGDAAKFNAALAKVERSVDSVVGGMGRALAGAGDAMTVAVTAPLSAGATMAAKWAAGVAGAAEQADIALSTMLGPERAKALLEDLADFAKNTPFEMSGLTSATQKLLAYGFAADDVIPLLTSVGDATAGLGAGQEGIDAVTRAIGQMQAKGKVMSEEMLQLTEVGIPAWQYLADALGTDVAGAQELVTRGAVDAETAIKALQDGMNRDFGGLMAEQATTLQGVLSNLSDAIEAPLRKLKDTKGWADMTEALSRLSESAGPLVERALPVLDDLLSDLAGVVTDVAGALDGLDTSDLEGIARAAVALAGAGPAMSVAGRGLQAVSKGVGLAGGAARVGVGAIGRLSDGLLDLATAPKSADTALGRLAATVLSVPAPMAALAAVAGGLLVTAIGAVAAEAAEAAEHEALLEEATASAGEIMSAASAGADALGDSVAGIATDAEGALEGLAELNASVSETLGETAADSGTLDRYASVIAELANRSGLTAVEQHRLTEAVEGFNSITGESYSVVDAANGKIADQNGELQENADKLLESAEAWKSRARAEAMSSVASDYMEAEVESANELRVAQEALSSAQGDYASTLERMRGTSDKTSEEYQDLAAHLDELNRQMPDLEREVVDLSDAHEAAARNAEDFSNAAALESAVFGTLGDRSGDFVDALMQSGVSLGEFAALSDEELAAIAAAWDGTTDGIGRAIEEAGVSVGAFSSTLASVSPELQGTAATLAEALGVTMGQLETELSDAGVSAEQLNAVSSQQFAAMAAACGGSISALAWMVQNYNATPILDKSGAVTVDQTQLVDAEGNVYEWNGSTLVDQSGEVVVDTVQLTDAQGNVVEWNGSELKVLQGAAEVDDGDLQSALDLVGRWNRSSLKTLTGSATVTTTNRTVNVVETQSAQRSAPAASRMAAAPASLSAEPAQGQASAQLSAVVARLAASPLPAPLMATAADALGAAASRAAESRAARAASRAAEAEAAEVSSMAREIEDAIEGATQRIEEAVSGPVRIVWDTRELGRLVKEATG